MDVATLDCGYNVSFFEMSLARFSESGFPCLFMTNPPKSFSSSVVYQTVLKKVQCLPVSTGLLFVQAPAFFRRLECGVNDVVAGVLSVGAEHFGLIASFHSDPFGETFNILRLFLPIILAGLRCLLTGCFDAVGKPVDVCRDIYILGGLSCRSMPLPDNFAIPAELYRLLDCFPRAYFGSCNFWASCNYAPYLADWYRHELYLPIGNDFELSRRGTLLQDFISSLPDGGRRVLHNEEKLDRSLSLQDLPNFLVSVYCPRVYSRWRSIPDIAPSSASHSDMFFTGIWLQRLRLDPSSPSKAQSCYHFFVDQDADLSRETFIASAPNIGYSFHEEHDADNFEVEPRSSCDSADSYEAYVGDCSWVLIQKKYPLSVFTGRYIIFQMDVRRLIRWNAAVCIFRNASLISSSSLGGCLFGCTSPNSTIA